jgi:tripartite-type tricarboxylate transporter receptor subunit TctC
MIKQFLIAISFFCTITAYAQTTVSIIWPFAPGSTSANYVRTLIEDANSQQSKYLFVFEHKPGAGGSIAMNNVLLSDRLTIVSNSNSFYTRPLYYPNESYNVDSFVPVITQMVGQPIAVASKKFANVNSLKTQKKLTIGIISGSITQLVAETLQKKLPGVELLLVPYPSTVAATRDVLGGHIDLSVDFANDLEPFVKDNQLSIVGITGKKEYLNFPTFASQGHREFDDIVQNYFLFVKKDVSPSVHKELHEIFRKANNNIKTTELYLKDYGTPVDQNLTQSTELFQKLKSYWKNLIQ